MANRYYPSQFIYSFERMAVVLEGSCVIGASGAVSGLVGSGIKSISKTATGTYKIVLDDAYNRLLAFNVTMVAATAGTPCGVDTVEVIASSDVTSVTEPKINIQTILGGSVANPVSGSVMLFQIKLRNSSLKGKGE